MVFRRVGLVAALLLCLLLVQPALAKRTLAQDVSRHGSQVGMWARGRAAATSGARGAAV
jgi:hypothetical protein